MPAPNVLAMMGGLAILAAPYVALALALRRRPYLSLKVRPGRELVAALAAFALGAALTHRAGAGSAAVLAVAVAVAGLLACRIILRDLWRVHRFARLAASGDLPAARAHALQTIRGLERFGASHVMLHAATSLATTLGAIGDPQGALDVARAADGQRLHAEQAYALSLVRALYEIRTGRLAEAEATLAKCTTLDGTPAQFAHRELLGARLDAANGRAESALAMAGAREGGDWALVRAHALCALGRQVEAQRILEAVMAGDHGRAIVLQVASGLGPAASLARSIIGEAAPYR